ncbi:MAG: signal recognition particle-docking protein FtsY [Gammaproteobacteria bacterium]|nr:signal recognition particle-docking protein FtsY [Gammaproteobacteria bacterium]
MTSDDTAAPKSPERGGLFALFRRRKDSAESAAPLQPTPEPAPEARVASLADRVADSGLAVPAVVVEKPAPMAAPVQGEEPARRGLFRRALARTGAGLGNLLLGRKAIDAELYEELETSLLMADVGVETASAVIAELTARVKRRNLGDAQALRGELRALLLELLEPCQQPLVIDRQTPFVMLVVGVNGVGKTTTIGKLAHRLQSEGRTLMLAAGDTFRAAAVEQLQAWGERNRVPVVSQGMGADSASVIFDAIQSAQARQLDVVIADTAGRLHTKDNLMAELTKVRRVMAKLDPDAPHETLLVLDAGTGQNAVVQMRQFSAAVAVTGIALTKLDGTAKGGVIFALCREFGVPIRYVGLGEGIDDLQPFDAELFVDALLATSDNVG